MEPAEVEGEGWSQLKQRGGLEPAEAEGRIGASSEVEGESWSQLRQRGGLEPAEAERRIGAS